MTAAAGARSGEAREQAVGAALLLCADPLAPRRPDPHFAPEAAAARALGLPTALIDHDALLAGEADAAVARVPRGGGPAWYRGWMVPSERYAALAEALARRGVPLLTSPARYRRAHELPGWYDAFAAVTPRSVWTSGVPARGEAAPATAALGGGPAIVKDYVKSRKHEWDEACYVPDLGDRDGLARVVARFAELQGEFLTGGIVVRAFERLDADAGEARVWWLDGTPVAVTAHPDTPALLPRPALDAVRGPVAALGCRFVTTDLALREDGVWRVVEVGDGQVSDRPAGHDPSELLAALAAAGPDGPGDGPGGEP